MPQERGFVLVFQFVCFPSTLLTNTRPTLTCYFARLGCRSTFYIYVYEIAVDITNVGFAQARLNNRTWFETPDVLNE